MRVPQDVPDVTMDGVQALNANSTCLPATTWGPSIGGRLSRIPCTGDSRPKEGSLRNPRQPLKSSGIAGEDTHMGNGIVKISGVTTALDTDESSDVNLVCEECSDRKDDCREIDDTDGLGDDTRPSGDAEMPPRLAMVIPAGVRLGSGAIFLRGGAPGVGMIYPDVESGI